jgi:hypothetical protein
MGEYPALSEEDIAVITEQVRRASSEPVPVSLVITAEHLAVI